MSEVKQVIVIRKDLNMRKGKIAAQAAHAALAVVLDRMLKTKHPPSRLHEWVLEFPYDSPWEEWLNGHFTKVVLYVNSEDELRDLYNKASDKGLPCAFIVDSGFTEFHGNKTATCIAIGPDYSDKIDEITGDLPLL